MNAVFAIIFIISLVYLLIINPSAMLPALMDGSRHALSSLVTLFCIYALWVPLSRLAEKSNLTYPLKRGLKPIVSRLFKTDDSKAVEAISMNISCNLLGIGGAATPYGLKAMGYLGEKHNTYAQKLLFVLNASSVQLIPITGISLRASMGSSSAYDIILPCLITTLFCAGLSVTMYIVGHRLWRI